MANIYDLTNEFQTLWNLMEEGNLPDEVLAEIFETTTEELAIKLEGYCKFIKNCESDIKGLREEEKRLAERRHTLENTIDRAKKAMQTAMQVAGEHKLPCGTFTVSVQKNPPKLVLDDPSVDGIPDRYLVPQEPTINKALMLDDFKSAAQEGEKFGDVPDLVGIAHVEQDESLRIR